VTRRFHPVSLFTPTTALRPGIGLALGGGFARGYAHLGVSARFGRAPHSHLLHFRQQRRQHPRRRLCQWHPPPSIIAKCREIRFRDFARWRVSRFGLASNKRLGALVHRFFDSNQFEDLAIPTAIVATDLGTGDPVVFKQGSLADAIRASCAFRGFSSRS